MKKFLKRIIPNKVVALLSLLLFLIKRLFKLLFWVVVDLFTKVKQNKVSFVCFCGKGYGDNPKFVAEELLKQKMSTSLDMVWIVYDEYKNEIPKQIRTVKAGSLRAIYELATSKVWIYNSRSVYGTRKKRSQFYIQLMHGAIPLKKIEKDADRLPFTYVINAKSDSKMIDLMISNCDYWTKKMPETYWYKGRILQTGIPKNDLFCSKKLFGAAGLRVRETYSIPNETLVVLYAPTFRSNVTCGRFDIDLDLVKRVMENKTRRAVAILVRLHPNVVSYSKNFVFKCSDAIDATSYPDMSELLCASDVLITDYSNTMFQMMITKKPVFLFMNDLDEYDRGLYFCTCELPFAVSKTNEELINQLKEFNMNDYLDAIDLFCQKTGFKEDGLASKRIAEIVLGVVSSSYGK